MYDYYLYLHNSNTPLLNLLLNNITIICVLLYLNSSNYFNKVINLRSKVLHDQVKKTVL